MEQRLSVEGPIVRPAPVDISRPPIVDGVNTTTGGDHAEGALVNMPTAKPTSLRIRSYNVGFGDCFLLSFQYPNTKRHMLIDFGSTAGAIPGVDLLRVAKQIRTDCTDETGEAKLSMVVATHRHADHIQGFGGAAGRIIADLAPELVVQPWTESPDVAIDSNAPADTVHGARGAAAQAVRRLSDMHAVAAAVHARYRQTAKQSALRRQLAFLGESNLTNADAVKGLMKLGNKHVYAKFGDSLPIGTLLPGVKIDVLGPPTPKQYPDVAHQTETSSEFWNLSAKNARADTGPGNNLLFPNAPVARSRPQETNWLIPRIQTLYDEELLGIVRNLDDAMNNTSLILLMELPGQVLLLFPGDAQIENWAYALHTAPDHAKIAKRLAATDVYKVGHHGSLNATPKSLWASFTDKGSKASPDRLITMLSTKASKHGSESRNSEVPRKTLVAALEKESDLHTTQNHGSKTDFWSDVELTLGS
jgi:hypothetical protein